MIPGNKAASDQSHPEHFSSFRAGLKALCNDPSSSSVVISDQTKKQLNSEFQHQLLEKLQSRKVQGFTSRLTDTSPDMTCGQLLCTSYLLNSFLSL